MASSPGTEDRPSWDLRLVQWMSRSAGTASGQAKDSKWNRYFPVFLVTWYGIEIFADRERHMEWYWFALLMLLAVVTVGRLIRARRRRQSHGVS
jgi:hypothetical protein